MTSGFCSHPSLSHHSVITPEHGLSWRLWSLINNCLWALIKFGSVQKHRTGTRRVVQRCTEHVILSKEQYKQGLSSHCASRETFGAILEHVVSLSCLALRELASDRVICISFYYHSVCRSYLYCSAGFLYMHPLGFCAINCEYRYFFVLFYFPNLCARRHWQACCLPATPCWGAGVTRPGTPPRQSVRWAPWLGGWDLASCWGKPPAATAPRSQAPAPTTTGQNRH